MENRPCRTGERLHRFEGHRRAPHGTDPSHDNDCAADFPFEHDDGAEHDRLDNHDGSDDNHLDHDNGSDNDCPRSDDDSCFNHDDCCDDNHLVDDQFDHHDSCDNWELDDGLRDNGSGSDHDDRVRPNHYDRVGQTSTTETLPVRQRRPQRQTATPGATTSAPEQDLGFEAEPVVPVPPEGVLPATGSADTAELLAIALALLAAGGVAYITVRRHRPARR